MGEGEIPRTVKQIMEGDTVQVQKGARVKHGDLVAYECPPCTKRDGQPVYHARFYYPFATLKVRDFWFATSQFEPGERGDRFTDSDHPNIIGPVVMETAGRIVDSGGSLNNSRPVNALDRIAAYQLGLIG